jgi:hypothetical protein
MLPGQFDQPGTQAPISIAHRTHFVALRRSGLSQEPAGSSRGLTFLESVLERCERDEARRESRERHRLPDSEGGPAGHVRPSFFPLNTEHRCDLRQNRCAMIRRFPHGLISSAFRVT